MSQFAVSWDREATTVSGSDELDVLLDRIAADPEYQRFPVVAEIVHPEQTCALQILLGRQDLSFLIWYVVKSTIEASKGTIDVGDFAFNYGGSRTDSYRDTAIPVDLARQAGREFVLTGKRPENVEWQHPSY